jgi:hypothetical protein
MDQLARLKDSVFGYFSPKRSVPTMPDAKRRRTVGPPTPSKDLIGEPAYEPILPRGQNAQVALYSRLSTKYFSTSITNPLKRRRKDEEDAEDGDEGEQLDVAEDVEINLEEPEEDGDSINPEDSPSQITAQFDEDNEEEENGSDEDGDGDEVEDEYDEDDVEQPIDEEASAREKVEEYLARQAELALKKDAIAEVKQQGTWHPDEVYLFERLSLRSFEALIPREWQIDFRTLPEDLFGERKDKVLINYNCRTSFHGKWPMNTIGVGG